MIIDWINNNEAFIWWLVFSSLIIFIVTLFLVPFILTKLPVDYFSSSARHRMPSSGQHPLLRVVLFSLKNSIGLLLVIAGIFMLVLPGQGILTIITGFLLLNFPGKYRVERWLVKRHYVHRVITWIRRRAGKADLLLDNEDQ
jgi:archaellum biogenesis protein FlaJ (TadC family)